MATKLPDLTCPKCGEVLDFDEVDIGVGVARGNFRCPNCFWSDDVATNDRCSMGPLQLHTWSLSDGKQCEHCLKFKPEIDMPEGMEGIDYGNPH